MYNSYNITLRAAHFDFLPFLGPTPEEIVEANITLSPVGKIGVQRKVDFVAGHFAYFAEQTTQVCF